MNEATILSAVIQTGGLGLFAYVVYRELGAFRETFGHELRAMRSDLQGLHSRMLSILEKAFDDTLPPH